MAAESFTFEPESVTRAAEIFADFAAEMGFCTEMRHFEKAGCGLVVSTPGTDGIPVCFVAHLDTVHPIGGFPDLLKPGPEGGLYGPGIVDCKGGAVIALLTMLALRETGCSRPLRLILAPDEEASNRLTGEEGIRFIQEYAKGCQAAFVCECGKPNEAVVERKGITKAQIEIRGKAAHAGMYYDQGISAIREAAYQILALEQESRSEAVTYNCGLISGGTTENVVPEFCTYSVDIRYRTVEEGAKALEYLKKVITTPHVPGACSSLHILSTRSPMPRSQAGMALFETIRSAGLKYGLEDLKPMANGGGSDAAYTAAAGVPTVCALGMTGWDWHSIRERSEPGALVRRAKLLAAAILELDTH